MSLVRSMGSLLSRETPCANLTDVTLADEDTNSILTDNANRAVQGNVAMQIILDQVHLACRTQLWNLRNSGNTKIF